MGSMYRKGNSGIFLLEVLYAVLIFGILALAIIYSLNQTFRAFRKANDITKATYLAEELLFQEIVNPGSVDKEGEFPAPFGNFSWKKKIKSHPTLPKFSKITLTLQDEYGREHYVTISTFMEQLP